MTDAKLAELEVLAEEDMYTKMKKLEGLLEFLELQEEYIKDEQKNLKRELIRAQVRREPSLRGGSIERRIVLGSLDRRGIWLDLGGWVLRRLLASPFCSLRSGAALAFSDFFGTFRTSVKGSDYFSQLERINYARDDWIWGLA